MADFGEKIAEQAVKTITRKIHRTYQNAARELTAKLSDFTKAHKAKDKVMREKVEKGLISEQDYQDWMTGQLFMEKQWKDKIDQCARIMTNANQEASKVVHTQKLDVFAENYNYGAYQLEKRAGANLGFELYNQESVAKLISHKPQTLPKWKINEKKDYDWNYKKVKNSITQGIIQGESVDQIADRLVSNLCAQNEDKMRNFARTAVTGAQNAGRQAQMEEAEDLGIKVKKRWLATLDNRTRDAHAELDGQEVPVDEPFSVDFDGKEVEIMFPGDPSCDEPGMVYNCRCTMIQVYEGIDRKSVRRDEDDNEVVDMTYKEWKEAKENGTLNTEKKLVEPPIGSEVDESSIIQGASREEILDKTMDYNNKINEAVSDISHLDDEYSKLYTDSLTKFGTDEYDQITARMDEIEKEVKEKREAVEDVQKEMDAYLSNKEEGAIMEAFGKIEGEHSVDDDVRAVNEITGDVATQKNCGSCALAYDARRRDIDCEAVPWLGTNANEIEKWWDGFKFQNATSYYGADARKEIEEYAKECGEGSRGIIDIRWSITQGHVFNYEVVDGVCRFLDGQTSAENVYYYFDSVKPGSVKFGRTDDKDLTRRALLCLRGAKK